MAAENVRATINIKKGPETDCLDYIGKPKIWTYSTDIKDDLKETCISFRYKCYIGLHLFFFNFVNQS